MPDNDYHLVRMIHPELKRMAEFPSTSVSQHYLAGWRLLTEDESRDAPPGESPLERLSAAEVLGGEPAPEDSGGEDAAGSKAAKGGKATGGRASGQSGE